MCVPTLRLPTLRRRSPSVDRRLPMALQPLPRYSIETSWTPSLMQKVFYFKSNESKRKRIEKKEFNLTRPILLDSDENEHYVYSYGGADHPHHHHHHPHHVPYYSDTAYTHPRQNSIKSHPSSSTTKRNPLSTNFLTDLFRPSSRRQPESLVDDEESAPCHRHRPKLRNYVMDYRPKQLNASTTWDNHRWYNKRDEPPPAHSLPTTPASLPARRQRIYPGAYTDGYSSDDEGAPLMMRRSVRSRRADPKRSW